VDSIFRNIRGVEKWLRGMCTFLLFLHMVTFGCSLPSIDIDTMVVSLQMEGEEVDYHLKSSDSEGGSGSFPYGMEWSHK